MSTGAKVGITALGILGSLVTACILISKHQTSKLTKLYNEKIQLQNLAEHIDFKEAKTVEEGIKFAKEVLKVGEVDSNFTLDAINYANRSITKVSNANKKGEAESRFALLCFAFLIDSIQSRRLRLP